MAKSILILLGSSSDLSVTGSGSKKLRDLGVGFSLRIASAHRSPKHVETTVLDFERAGGQIVICVAGKSAHLAGVVSALTTLPVFAVPVYSQETSGFDALLSMVQMPAGIPVATFGFGEAGFSNACILAAQTLALHDKRLAAALREERSVLVRKVLETDASSRIDFDGGAQ